MFSLSLFRSQGSLLCCNPSSHSRASEVDASAAHLRERCDGGAKVVAVAEGENQCALLDRQVPKQIGLGGDKRRGERGERRGEESVALAVCIVGDAANKESTALRARVTFSISQSRRSVTALSAQPRLLAVPFHHWQARKEVHTVPQAARTYKLSSGTCLSQYSQMTVNS